MRLNLFLLMLLQVGCATKYIIPGNRFMTPESQGGVFRTQFEFQQTSANQLSANLANSSVANGVSYEIVNRSGFLLSSSLLDEVDLFWTHTGGGNSLVGMKYQFMGASRTGNGAGHKMAVSAALGANEHETDEDPKVDFSLSGKEFQLLYGFRFNEMFLAFANLSYGKYIFDGDVKSSDPLINGLNPSYETTTKALYGGVEVSLGSFVGKLECGYQQLTTDDTKDKSHFIYGYSIGYGW